MAGTKTRRVNASEMRTALNTLNFELVGGAPLTPSLCPSGGERAPRSGEAAAGQRADILQQLAEHSICGDGNLPFQQVAAQAGQPDADPFDLLCHLAYNAPILTRRQRADRVKRQQAASFHYYQPEAQEILNELLEKYAADGELQFTLPDVLKGPPISQHGTVGEIATVFGGPDELRTAVNQLQSLLYTE